MIENTKNSTPLVSICCLTFNHENYIQRMLEGIVMQKTNFSYEIIIHDDASTDNTQSIILDYKEKYKNIIKPLLQTENQKSKYKSGMNPRFNFPRISGKYIALCEGDDYWTDPYKLQKQVDFLEANKNYSLCFTNSKYYIQKEDKFVNSKPVLLSDFNLLDYIDKGKKGIVTTTATALFNADILKNLNFPSLLEAIKNSPAGDTFIFSIILSSGRGKILNDITTVYRVTGAGASSKFNKFSWYIIRIKTLKFILNEKLIGNKDTRIKVSKKLRRIQKSYFQVKLKHKLSVLDKRK